MAAPSTPETPDPLDAARQRAQRTADDADRRIREIKDAPREHDVPEIPELLQTPIERPASMLPKAPTVMSGMGELGKSLAIGLDFLFSAAAGGVLGWLFDKWRGTFPIGTVVGAIIGFVTGTFRLLKRLNAPEPGKGPKRRP